MNEAGVSARRNMGKAGRAIIVEDFDLYKGIQRLADIFVSMSASVVSRR